jgi:hypothetical protein
MHACFLHPLDVRSQCFLSPPSLPLHDTSQYAIAYQEIYRDNVSNMAIRIRIGVYVLPITFLAVICVILFGCSPVQKHWQIYPDPGGTLSYRIVLSRRLGMLTRSFRGVLSRTFIPFAIYTHCVERFY